MGLDDVAGGLEIKSRHDEGIHSKVEARIDDGGEASCILVAVLAREQAEEDGGNLEGARIP